MSSLTNLNPDEGILEPGGALSQTVRNLAAPRPLTVSAPSGVPFCSVQRCETMRTAQKNNRLGVSSTYFDYLDFS